MSRRVMLAVPAELLKQFILNVAKHQMRISDQKTLDLKAWMTFCVLVDQSQRRRLMKKPQDGLVNESESYTEEAETRHVC